MTGELLDRNLLRHHFNHALRLGRRAGADGIAERNLVTAHVEELLRNVGDRLRFYVAFVGTTEHYRDVTAHAQAST